MARTFRFGPFFSPRSKSKTHESEMTLILIMICAVYSMPHSGRVESATQRTQEGVA